MKRRARAMAPVTIKETSSPDLAGVAAAGDDVAAGVTSP